MYAIVRRVVDRFTRRVGEREQRGCQACRDGPRQALHAELEFLTGLQAAHAARKSGVAVAVEKLDTVSSRLREMMAGRAGGAQGPEAA